MFDAFTVALVLISMIVGFYRRAPLEILRIIGLVASAKVAMLARDYTSGFFTGTLRMDYISGTIYSYIALLVVVYTMYCLAVILIRMATVHADYKTAKEIATENPPSEAVPKTMGLLFGGLKGLILALLIFHVWQNIPTTPAQHKNIMGSITAKAYKSAEKAFVVVPGRIPILENLTHILTTPGGFKALNIDPEFVTLARTNQNVKKVIERDNLAKLKQMFDSGRFDLLKAEPTVVEVFKDPEVIKFLRNYKPSAK